uniref:Hypotheticial protein n=1 Tax=Schistosoma japonicum TaxID=6182 RepID=C1LF19_SCHJA|nr:hypotheticial protein [Schistosoma japonicum]
MAGAKIVVGVMSKELKKTESYVNGGQNPNFSRRKLLDVWSVT